MPAPDLDDVLTAATTYGDAREQAARDELAPQIDAANRRADETDRALAALRAEFDAYRAAHPDTPPKPDPEPEPEPELTRKTIIGMSAPANLWDQRLREVGPEGIKARRIFANLTNDGRNQAALIEAAIRAGMTPVISYKGTPTAANCAAIKKYLTSLGTQVTATWHHEPHGDMTPTEFRTGSRTFLDAVRAPNIAVGPLLNGWLLDNRLADFKSYTDPDLLRDWDWFGFDSYQSGEPSAPGNRMPARAIPLAVKFLKDNGAPGKRIVVGEYNGHTAEAIKQAGNAILNEPTVWIACAWNSEGDSYSPLTGDRLTAFKATKADTRVAR